MNYANPYQYTDVDGVVHTIETSWPGHSSQDVQRVHDEAVNAMLEAFPPA